MRIPQLIYEFLFVYYNSYTNFSTQAIVAAVGGGDVYVFTYMRCSELQSEVMEEAPASFPTVYTYVHYNIYVRILRICVLYVRSIQYVRTYIYVRIRYARI